MQILFLYATNNLLDQQVGRKKIMKNNLRGLTLNVEKSRYYNVLAALEALQNRLEAQAALDQHHLNGITFVGLGGDEIGTVVNDRMCYVWRHLPQTSEKMISFDDIWNSLPAYWKFDSLQISEDNTSEVRKPCALINFECVIEMYPFFDPQSNPFDVYDVYTDDIMQLFVNTYDGIDMDNPNNKVWDIMSWILNNFDVYADDMIRDNYSYAGKWVQTQIASAFYGAVADTVMSGLLLFVDNDSSQPDNIMITHSEYFLTAFVKHLWISTGLTAYPDGDAYEWDE
jgi:hypothetical protein